MPKKESIRKGQFERDYTYPEAVFNIYFFLRILQHFSDRKLRLLCICNPDSNRGRYFIVRKITSTTFSNASPLDIECRRENTSQVLITNASPCDTPRAIWNGVLFQIHYHCTIWLLSLVNISLCHKGYLNNDRTTTLTLPWLPQKSVFKLP